MLKPKPLFLSIVLFLFSSSIFSQTGTIPTGTDTSCTNGISLFQKVYGGNYDDQGTNVAVAADSGYVISGWTKSFGNGGYDGLLVKTNKKGNVLWSKAIGGSGDDYFNVIKRTSDNGFIVCGQTKSYGNPAGDGWLVKVDAAGNIQWSKKYGDGNIYGDFANEVIQLSDGGYAFCGMHKFSGGVTESFVVRTDNQGNVTWSKQYGAPNSDEAWGITEDGNYLMVVGFYYGISFYDGYVMKLDKSTGVIQWIKGYDVENRSTRLARISKTNTGYQVMSYVLDDFSDTNQQLAVLNLNTDGTVQNVRKSVIPGIKTNSMGWYPFADGGFMVANSEATNNADIIFAQVNASGGLAWSKKFLISGKQTVSTILPSTEGGYTGAGTNSNVASISDSNNVFLMRVDSLGNAGVCSGITTSDLTIINPSYSLPTPAVVALGDVTINNPVIAVGVVNLAPITNTLCFYCQPKPTGTLRTTTEPTDHHVIKVYPNPVEAGRINVSIDAQYNDRVIISIVDLFGNIYYKSTLLEIHKGNNVFSFNTPVQLLSYRNYFMHTRFDSYEASIQIFVKRN